MKARYFGLLSPGEVQPELLFATEEWLARAYEDLTPEMRRHVRVVIVDLEIHRIEEKH